MSYRPPPGECTYDTDACSRRKGSDTVIPQKRQTICAFVLRALHTNIYIVRCTLDAVRWYLEKGNAGAQTWDSRSKTGSSQSAATHFLAIISTACPRRRSMGAESIPCRGLTHAPEAFLLLRMANRQHNGMLTRARSLRRRNPLRFCPRWHDLQRLRLMLCVWELVDGA